ncbi:MAG: hypothetical protein KDB53_19670, partial [Planctomycetes bacterium]|nr:hypothetical protein [Planctomycetota bacterium]
EDRSRHGLCDPTNGGNTMNTTLTLSAWILFTLVTLPAQTTGIAGVVSSHPLPVTGLPGVDVGDFDGDGLRDIALYGNGSIIVLSGADWSTLTTVTSPVMDISGVCDAGDVDNDGTPDLFIAGGLLFSPTPYLLSGASGNVLWSIPGQWPIVHPGGSIVAGGQDLDGSGSPDMVFCTRTELWALSGTTGAALWPPHLSGSSISCSSVCIVPSVDGDASPDIVVGLTGNAYPASGRVRCISGSTGAIIWQYLDQSIDQRNCGEQVASITDLDGDGHRDILVSERRYGGSYNDPRVLSGLNGQTMFDINGFWGAMAAEVGDLNSDGVVDIGLISDAGSIMVSGADGRIMQTFVGGGGAALVTSRGDSSGDGMPDMVVLKYDELLITNPFGTAEYGALADPTQALAMSWTIDPASPSGGTLHVVGGAPFSPLLFLSAPLPFTFIAGGTTILVDFLSVPTNTVVANFDGSGNLNYPMSLIQPGLTYQRYFVQAFDLAAGAVQSSNGLEMKFLTL